MAHSRTITEAKQLIRDLSRLSYEEGVEEAAGDSGAELRRLRELSLETQRKLYALLEEVMAK